MKITELHSLILDAYEKYYYSNFAVNNEDEEGCARWIGNNAPTLDELETKLK